MDYVQTDGAAALKKAMERSEEFGQHSSKMSEIAREARALAEKWVCFQLRAITLLSYAVWLHSLSCIHYWSHGCTTTRVIQ